MNDTYFVNKTELPNGAKRWQVFAWTSKEHDPVNGECLQVDSFTNQEIADDFAFLLNWTRGMRTRGITYLGPST